MQKVPMYQVFNDNERKATAVVHHQYLLTELTTDRKAAGVC